MEKLNKEEVMTKFLEDNGCKIEYLFDYESYQKQPFAVLNSIKILELFKIEYENNSSWVETYEEYNDLDFYNLLDELGKRIQEIKSRIKGFENQYKKYID